MALYILNENEIAILREVIGKVLGQPTGFGQRAPPIFDNPQAPGTYIAWPPEGGIPALTVVGTAGPGGNDQPGSATCDIYRIDDSGTAELAPITALDKTVYNLSSEVVSQEWIVVTLTKGGRWVAVSPAILPEGSTTNDILYWDESGTVPEWVILPAPATSGDFALTVSDGVLAWTSISTFACPE